MTTLRRLLGYRVSIEAMIEVLLWLALPYLFIGLVWTFFHPDQVQAFEDQLSALPVGADLVAFGLTTVLWPVLLLGAEVCAA